MSATYAGTPASRHFGDRTLKVKYYVWSRIPLQELPLIDAPLPSYVLVAHCEVHTLHA